MSGAVRKQIMVAVAVAGLISTGCEVTGDPTATPAPGSNEVTVAITPSVLNFGELAPNTSKDLTLTVSNVGGTATTSCNQATLIGPDPEEFLLVSDTCQGKSLAPGKSCTATFRATPRSAGAKSSGVRVLCSRQGIVDSSTSMLQVTGVVPATPSPTPVEALQSAVFNFTGENQSFIVPDGVTSIQVKMWGAGGESGNQDLGNLDCEYQPGGGGGFASGTLNVTPGQVLTIRVGGRPLNFIDAGWPNGGIGFVDEVHMGARIFIFGANGGGGGSSSVLADNVVLMEAGGGNGGAGCETTIAGGGIRNCVNPGNQVGASYHIAPGSGGGGYCGGADGAGGSSFIPEGGTELAGSGALPGNADDADRASAGQGAPASIIGGSATHGLVKISW